MFGREIVIDERRGQPLKISDCWDGVGTFDVEVRETVWRLRQERLRPSLKRMQIGNGV